MALRMSFETRATSGSSASAYAPPRLTKPVSFLRFSASEKDSPNSLAICVVMEVPPFGIERLKTLFGSMKMRFVVREPMSMMREQPVRSL